MIPGRVVSIGSEFKLPGIIPVRNIPNAFRIAHNPELSSECPIFVFTDPMRSGSLR